MKIVFMGTPAFAVSSLRTLLDCPHHEVVCVVTRPDRPKGRGLKPGSSPIKQMAVERGVPVLQPEELEEAAFLQALRNLRADLFAVVAFRILPASVFTLPSRGTVNLHASLLPKYRGAAPIQWAIINGEHETGVTTFFIEQGVDAGRILLQRRVPIKPDETAEELHDRLSEIGAQTLLETIDQLAEGRIEAVPQEGKPTRAPKLSKEDGRIDWTRPAWVIHNRIRGLNPYPVAFTTWRDRTIRVWRSRMRPDVQAHTAHAGEVVALADDEVVVNTGNGCLGLMEVQPEGRRRMNGGDFVRGYRIGPGDRFDRIPALPAEGEI